MRKSWLATAAAAAAIIVGIGGMAGPASAHDFPEDDHIHLTQAVVPEAEMTRAQELMAQGPSKSAGISAVNVLGQLSLDGEFTSSDGLVMRIREIITEPGGVVAVHQHVKRPGVAYVMTGEMTEHRSSDATPNVKPAGSVAMEKSGMVHWWENTGDVPSRAIVVDIVPAN